jgi:hypothetical protein
MLWKIHVGENYDGHGGVNHGGKNHGGKIMVV